MNYYVFVNSRSHDWNDKVVPSFKIASYRIKNKVFPLYTGTKHQTLIKPNDSFIFYLAGRRKQVSFSFVAYGKIEGVEINDNYSEDDMHLSAPIEKIVKLKPIVEYKPVSIYLVKDKLSFVTKKKKWGASLQGGIIKITKEDFDTIVKEMNK